MIVAPISNHFLVKHSARKSAVLDQTLPVIFKNYSNPFGTSKKVDPLKLLYCNGTGIINAINLCS